MLESSIPSLNGTCKKQGRYMLGTCWHVEEMRVLTFGEYVDALRSTDLFKSSWGRKEGRVKIGWDLFTIAAPNAKVSESAIKTWINGSRNCNIDLYFQDRSMCPTDETKFISYLSDKAPGDSWRKMQDEFRQLNVNEELCVDLDTEDRDVFFRSLLKQFQRIFLLQESKQKEEEPAVSPTEIPQEQSPEQIRNEFLETIHRYGIMDIINRDPPVLNRNDSKALTAFVKETEGLLYKDVTPPNIRSFIMTLEYRAIDLEGKLKFRFGSTNETASINMLGDKIRLWDRIISKVKAKRLGIPELTPELIENAADPLHLYRLLLEDWGSFRDQMNLWFEHISSNQDKT